MTKNILYFFSIIFLFSCSKDSTDLITNKPQEEETNFYFNLNQTQINSTSFETEFKINISTNTNWEVESKPDWVKITPENGNENIEIEVTLYENKNENSRNGNIEFKSIGKIFTLKVSQNGFPLKLVSYSGSESPIKMNETKFLLFNKAITLNSITSGEDRYSFFAGPNDIEYFDNNHGVKFRIGPSNLGSQHKYKFSVKDNDNNTLEQIVDLNFYSQKIIVSGAIKKIILDNEKNLWVLSIKMTPNGEPSYIFKFKENEGNYEEELKFEVDIDYSYSSFVGGDFFINPYNNLIYIPDWEGEEIEVYSKTGSMIKKISIPSVDSDHPQNPHSSPYAIGFTNSGKGIISLAGKGISNLRWRFIDSRNDDILTQPKTSHPFYYKSLQSFVLNMDNSKLYVLEERSSLIKVFDGQEAFEIINMKSLYPNGADAAKITQNRRNDKIYVAGLYNQQIITPDFSYLSKQSYTQFFLGDFSYDPNLQNHIYALTGAASDVRFKLLDYNNQNTVMDLPINSYFSLDGSGIITSPDDDFIIVFTNRSDISGRSQIIVFDIKMFK